MKINSILTQDVDCNGRVLSYSKSTFKKGRKPECKVESELFMLMDPKISGHLSQIDGVERFVVTISTTKGKFIKTYKAHNIL